MNAARQLQVIHTTRGDKRLLDRDDAICEALRNTVGGMGLSPQAESDLWLVAREHIEPILHLADAATVARLELEAIERRLTAHAQTHRPCLVGEVPCGVYRLLGFRWRRFQERADRAYRDLCSGRRR